jgi:hypothetical protein
MVEQVTRRLLQAVTHHAQPMAVEGHNLELFQILRLLWLMGQNQTEELTEERLVSQVLHKHVLASGSPVPAKLSGLRAWPGVMARTFLKTAAIILVYGNPPLNHA